MADHTHIEWTDATWNPITGCSVLSPGCTNCYAMKLAGTRLQHHPSRAGLTRDTKAGPVWTGEVRFNEHWLLQPLQWKKPRKIFVCAHADLFHENVPDEWIDRIFAVMALAPQHIFQVLTKRPERMRAYVRDQSEGGRYISDHICRILAPLGEHGYDTALANDQEQLRTAIARICGSPTRPRVLPNVWLGVSVEDRERMLERAPLLKTTPAAVRWWSAEPLLGSLGGILPELMPDWIVVGGESGPGARPMHPDWARSVRDQCAAAGVPFHFKQWGAWYPAWGGSPDPIDARHIRGAHIWGSPINGRADTSFLVGKKLAGRLLDGVEHNGVPA